MRPSQTLESLLSHKLSGLTVESVQANLSNLPLFLFSSLSILEIHRGGFSYFKARLPETFFFPRDKFFTLAFDVESHLRKSPSTIFDAPNFLPLH